jgi:hypothetical protein
MSVDTALKLEVLIARLQVLLDHAKGTLHRIQTALDESHVTLADLLNDGELKDLLNGERKP